MCNFLILYALGGYNSLTYYISPAFRIHAVKQSSWYSRAIELEPERSPMYSQPKAMAILLLFSHVADTMVIIPKPFFPSSGTQ